MNNQFFFNQSFLLLLLLYLYVFYRSNGLQENFFFFKGFGYKSFFTNIKYFDHKTLSSFHAIFSFTLFLVFLVLLVLALFNDWYYSLECHKPFFSLAEEKDIYEHLDVKRTLIDMLNTSNKALEEILLEKAEGKGGFNRIE